jgi:glutamate dehydrogenase/leucine dehydrogenase
LSERELRHLSKDYVQALHGMLGSATDVLMQDWGSNPQVLAWMLDSHARAVGRLEPGAVMGKPRVLFGLPDNSATARGLFDTIRLAVEESGRKLGDIRVALQGLGVTGSALLRLLEEAGAHLVAAADISGGVLCEDGISVSALLDWTASNGTLLGFSKGDSVTNGEVLEAGCDLLVLAAAPRQVTAINAPHLQVPLVVEAIQGAITHAAAQILEARHVTVVPALVAGAGATAAAYMEWSLNVGHEGFLLDGVEENIRLRMEAACAEARHIAQRHNVSFRQGALLTAVDRVAGALRLR